MDGSCWYMVPLRHQIFKCRSHTLSPAAPLSPGNTANLTPRLAAHHKSQVALPTSAGYGTAFGGVTPLLAALNSAAPGVTVVNIDSGFGAAMAAWRILVNAARVRNAVIQAHAAAGPG